MVDVHGTVAAGFEAVREAFVRNFDEHGEVGAAVCAYHHGEPVVDLWAGVADPASGRPYAPDVLQLVFSSTKGAVAIAAHLLAQRGELDLDAPVATYWPEFAANGKADIPVRWLLSHRSGLVGLDRVLSVDELCDWDTVVAALAAQAPLWEPGTAHGYHALTFGHLVGEVVRRISGHSMGDFVRKELCEPLGIEVHIGVPESEMHRVAPLLDFVASPVGDDADPTIAAILTPGSMTQRAFLIAPIYITGFNEPQLLRAEIPAANGCTNARSLARLYAATVGEVDGVRLLDADTVEDARRPQSVGDDLVLVGTPDAIGTGFFLPDEVLAMLGPGSFGHAGLGGSLGCALPEEELALGYVMNQCQAAGSGDPRTAGLLAALTASVSGR